MAITVNYFTGTFPTPDPSINYRKVTLSGPPRKDLILTVNSWCENDDGTYSIYATVMGAKDASGDFTFIDSNQTSIQVYPMGFSVRTGSPFTNAKSSFEMIFDSLTDFPDELQIQVGVKGGGGSTPNSGFVFSKTKVTADLSV